MSTYIEMERDRLVAAIEAEFAAGPQLLERMNAIARRHCGSRWWPTCMPEYGGGFHVTVLVRQSHAAVVPSGA